MEWNSHCWSALKLWTNGSKWLTSKPSQWLQQLVLRECSPTSSLNSVNRLWLTQHGLDMSNSNFSTASVDTFVHDVLSDTSKLVTRLLSATRVTTLWLKEPIYFYTYVHVIYNKVSKLQSVSLWNSRVCIWEALHYITTEYIMHIYPTSAGIQLLELVIRCRTYISIFYIICFIHH